MTAHVGSVVGAVRRGRFRSTAFRSRGGEGARRASPTEGCAGLRADFVREILDAAHFGWQGRREGYGAMAVEALASGVEAGGGLGLARQIEHALSRQHEAERHIGGVVTGKR